MTIAAQSVSADTTASIRAQKVIHAAHEFEAVLLNTMLGPLEQTFSSLPGKTKDSESDNYHYLGMQALSSALAANSGLGFANMMIHGLLKSGPETKK